MALFPSFAGVILDEGFKEKKEEDEQTWLKASSFRPTSILNTEQNADSNEYHDPSATTVSPDVSCVEHQQPSPKHSLKLTNKRGDDESLKKKRHKKEKKKHKHKHEKEKKSKERKRSPERKKYEIPPPNKVFLEEIRGLEFKDAFRLDRRSDPDNYRFSCLNKKHIACYRWVYKVPLGVRRQEVKQYLSGGKAPSLNRYYEKKIVSRLYTAGMSVVCSKDSGPLTSLPNIIDVPVIKHADQLEKTADNPLGIYDKSTELWLQGRAPDQINEEKTSDDSYLGSKTAQKISELNKMLREDPQAVENWLELVDLQDGLLQHRTEDDSRKLFTEKSIHEKKLAIISQALAKNPYNLTLMLRQLELNGKTMDWAEISEQWKSLTFTHINEIQVWRGYLKHIKSNFNKFSTSLLMRAYSKCLNSLRKVKEGVLKSHSPKPNMERDMIEILFELCDQLHLANSTEKAVSILQSMVEFNMYKPSTVSDHEQAIELFQRFFDSGEPRFGEPGAKGWCNSEEMSTILPAPLKPTVKQDEEEEERIIEKHKESSLNDVWVDMEHTRQISHWLPWRSAAGETDDDCVDPSRLIVSDDITSVLFYITDERLRFSMCYDVLRWFSSEYKEFKGTKCISGINELHRSLEGRCTTTPWTEYILSSRFISHCIEQLVRVLPACESTNLVKLQMTQQMRLVLNSADSKQRKSLSKNFRAYVKSLLSLEEHRNNQDLWLHFAECNGYLGLQSEMNAVYDSLLTGQPAMTTEGSSALARLKLYWTTTDGEMNQQTPSSERLLSLACWLILGGNISQRVSSLQRLQLVSQCETLLDQLWNKVPTESITQDAVLAQISYLAQSYFLSCVLIRGIKDFIQSVEHWTSLVGDHCLASSNLTLLKTFYTMTVKVLLYSQRWLYQSLKPLLRDVLQEAIRHFPDETDLLDAYLTVERSGFSVSRIRQMFSLGLNTADKSIKKEILALYAVLFELERLQIHSSDGETRGSISNRVRSLCERSLTTMTPHSVLLWRLYMFHESVYGSKHKVQSLFYAAIQACPYAKCLYADAITYMPEKIQEILDVAEEKEIRVHTPLEELSILLHKE